MMYTVASIKQHHTGFGMSLDNQYYLYLWLVDSEDEYKIIKSASKTYPSREDAKEAFLKVSICILDGTYSFEDRAKIAGIEKVVVS